MFILSNYQRIIYTFKTFLQPINVMDRVDREKEIAIGTVTVFLVWFVNGTGGGEPIIVKLVNITKHFFRWSKILFIVSTKICYKLVGNV